MSLQKLQTFFVGSGEGRLSGSVAKIRNAVLSGRQKDGYPAYLVGPEFLNMEHNDGTYTSPTGVVSASTEYDQSSYRATRALRNQVQFLSEGWLTKNGTTDGWWKYYFTDGPHRLCGIQLNNRACTNSQNLFPKNWRIKILPYDISDEDGVIFEDHSNEAWITVLDIKDGQNFFGYANNLKTHGRTFWFNEKSVKARAVVIEVDDNQTLANYTQIGVIKFFEDTCDLGLNQFDTYLYATANEPFKASIACGQEVLPGSNLVRTVDKTVIIKKSIPLDTSKLEEMSRNYIYLAPYDNVFTQDGKIKFQYEQIGLILHTNETQNVVILSSTKRINYNSIREVEQETLGLLGCNDPGFTSQSDGTLITGWKDHNAGSYKYPLYLQNVVKGYDGYPNAYQFYSTNAIGFISPNASLSDMTFPRGNMHPYSNECTVEMSFKWTGPKPDGADTYYVLFDQGWGSSRGWSLTYHNRKKCFSVHLHDKSHAYSIPFNADDEKWHYISVSIRDRNLYVHIDGKCLLAADQIAQYAPTYRYWMIGRWIHTNGYGWYGGVKDFRYTVGTAKFQSDDYDPKLYAGSSDLVSPGILWYNQEKGCVQYRAYDQWYDTPLLPIGHIDTGWKEHLLTDQPRGTYHLKGCKNFDPTGWASPTQYNTSHTAECLFNFGHGGEYPYATANNNTVEHTATFTLTEEKTFERLRFCNTTWDWRSYPCLFEFGYLKEVEGEVTEGTEGETEVVTEEFVPLISRTEFIDDGGFCHAIAKVAGDSEVISAYKTFDIDQSTPAKKYMLRILPKNEVLYYKDYGHTAARIMLTYNDAKPEILGRSSYVIGDRWNYGPVPILVGKDVEIPIPFANVPYVIDGEVEEEADFELKRRKIGITNFNAGASKNYDGYLTAISQYWSGELIYGGNDYISINTASNYTSPYFGRWNNAIVAASSNKANYYVTLRRKF